MAAPNRAASPTALKHTAIAVTQRGRLPGGPRFVTTVITVPVLL